MQFWFLETEFFLKFELQKFWFLRTEFFIKGKNGFLRGKKETWGLEEKSSKPSLNEKFWTNFSMLDT
jgi:hypothetical protein